MAAPRPYGMGPYGTGPYSRNAGALYLVGGSTTLLFGAKGAASKVIAPEAVSQIVWNVWSEHLTPNWMLPMPCETGGWTPASPCETGGWAAPDACVAGDWTLEKLP